MQGLNFFRFECRNLIYFMIVIIICMNMNINGFDAKFWRDVVENSLAGIFIIDEKLRFRYVNKVVEIATGYSRDEIYRMSVFDLAPEEDHPKIFEACERVLKGGRVFMENRFITKDGRKRWVWGFIIPIEFEGERLGLGNWIDITRAKKLEMRLKESEEFYRTLIEDSLTPIYIVQDGKFIYVNKAFELATGFKKDEVIGKEVFSVIHPEDRESVRRNYLKRLREGGAETYSFRMIDKSGKVRWITIRPARITVKGKEAVAVTAIDTTQIHELTEELRRKTEYLSLLNKILRHDILNDLTVIRAALELKDEKLIDTAICRIDRIRDLIQEAKSLEEAGGAKKAVNLAEIVREIADLYRKDAVIRLNLKDVYVRANEGLKTAIQNIINNAIMHSGRFPVEVEISTYAENGWGVIRIADNGKGIPDEMKDLIFQEGFSSEKRSGLGLFIVKKVTELYGGKIEVKDNEPSGAVFEIKLPIEKFG